MTKITAIIPTLNEEANVAKALASVAFADEIIVIDSYSTDKTLEIAKSYGATILQRKFDDFSSQKNYAINQAKYDWIFLLDADEVASEELQKEVRIKAANPEDCVGFYIYRKFYFKKKNLKYSGWRHDKVIRLFNKQHCVYKGKVHEKITTTGKLGFFNQKITHFSLRNIEKYRKKLDFYASLQALELFEEQKIVTPYHLLIKPTARFVIQYLVKFGFLDGAYGFTICRLHAYGVYLRYKKLIQLKRGKDIFRKHEKFRFSFPIESNSPEVSIIIVNYKSWNHLENCLKSLSEIKSNSFAFETIVVDNCSNDGKLTAFKAQFPKVKFVENTGNNGFANGCNFGARQAKGMHLLFLNPDTIASEKSIASMLSYAQQHEEVGIVSCLQKNNDDSYENVVRFFPRLITLFGPLRALYKLMFFNKLTKAYNEYEELAFPDWVSGSVVFMNRMWFLKINGWSEDYWMYFEDVDLSKKVRDLGGQIVLLENTEIIHNHGGASRINVKTTSLTKAEVKISKHVYISNHLTGLERLLAQFLLVVDNIIFSLIKSMVGIVFFFMPSLRLQLYITKRLFGYYLSSLFNFTWLSKRSMNY